MNQITNNLNSPWKSLVILLGLTLGCAIGVSLFIVLVELFFRGNITALLEGSASGMLDIDFKANTFYSYFSVIGGSVGTFLLPALILQKLESNNVYFPSDQQKTGLFMLLSVLFLVAFMPMMEFIGEMNLKMHLPQSMADLESWMRVQEDNMAELTRSMVMVDSWGLLFLNLFTVAVVPAIAEEYYFRGSLMNIVQRITKNTHLTIWLTAIIFSAIHVQFFGFFPRMLLGAFFGYMLVWTNNIWVPILAHFINNGTVVVMAFYYTRQGKTYEDLQSSEAYSLFVYLGSVFLSVLIGYYFYKKSKELKIADGEGLG